MLSLYRSMISSWLDYVTRDQWNWKYLTFLYKNNWWYVVVGSTLPLMFLERSSNWPKCYACNMSFHVSSTGITLTGFVHSPGPLSGCTVQCNTPLHMHWTVHTEDSSTQHLTPKVRFALPATWREIWSARQKRMVPWGPLVRQVKLIQFCISLLRDVGPTAKKLYISNRLMVCHHWLEHIFSSNISRLFNCLEKSGI